MFRSLGPVAIVWALVVAEVGRLRGGRVSRPWIMSVLGFLAAAVTVGSLSVAFDDLGVVNRLLRAVMVMTLALAAPLMIAENRRGRLGRSKQSRPLT